MECFSRNVYKEKVMHKDIRTRRISVCNNLTQRIGVRSLSLSPLDKSTAETYLEIFVIHQE